MVWRNLIQMQRAADAERRRDTRRKIQLGGLVIKAGLADEEPAVILGLLAAAKRVLNGAHADDSRRRWKDLGDQAFTQE
jgi:Conjugal transfer protein TraD